MTDAALLPRTWRGRFHYAVKNADTGRLRFWITARNVDDATAEAAAHPALAGERLTVERATRDDAERWRKGESLYHDNERTEQ